MVFRMNPLQSLSEQKILTLSGFNQKILSPFSQLFGHVLHVPLRCATVEMGIPFSHFPHIPHSQVLGISVSTFTSSLSSILTGDSPVKPLRLCPSVLHLGHGL